MSLDWWCRYFIDMSLQPLQADLGGREGTPQTLIRNKAVTRSSSDPECKAVLGRQAAFWVGAGEEGKWENSGKRGGRPAAEWATRGGGMLPDKCHPSCNTADSGCVHISRQGGTAKEDLGHQGVVFLHQGSVILTTWISKVLLESGSGLVSWAEVQSVAGAP